MFEGFSQQTIDFMWGIRFQNEKAWFEANKQTYLDHFYGPMRALAQDVHHAFLEKHGDLPLNLHISRIYRDARRLHGRGPYKDRLWFSFRAQQEDWTQAPTLWFGLAPDGYSFGLGYYAATPLTMAKLRARIDRNPQKMADLATALAKHPFLKLEGTDYKRPKGDVGELLNPWYNKKLLSIRYEAPLDEGLYSADLVDTLAETFDFLVPFYQYFSTLDSDPDPRT